MKFKVLFYQKEDGTEPAKVFLNNLDKKMRAKMVRTIETLQNMARICGSLILNIWKMVFLSCVPKLAQIFLECCTFSL